jgi:7-cyano-7-deazaguanine synthase in queuosine biosynthesis
MTIGKIGNKPVEGFLDTATDSLSRLGILAVIAGYKAENRIELQGAVIDTRIDLESLLSYILNHPRFSPIEFDVELRMSGTESPTSSHHGHAKADVVLFSGGIDSTSALLYLLDRKREVLPFFVRFGQKNQDHESERVDRLAAKLGLPVAVEDVDLSNYIDTGWSQWSYIVPARNFMLTTLGAAFAHRRGVGEASLHLVAHEEEIKPTNTDKSERFFSEVSQALSDYYGREFRVTTPFTKLTKTEVLAFWKRRWENQYGVSPLETTSCYVEHGCGHCNACVKRAVALSAAGYDVDGLTEQNPFDNQERLFQGFVDRFGSFPMKRQMELLLAIENNLTRVTHHVRVFYDNIGAQLRSSASDYRRHLQEVCLL